MRLDNDLTLDRQGDALVINGEVFDFSPLPEGAVLPRDAIFSRFIGADVSRRNGVLHVNIILPHGPNAPHDVLFPQLVICNEDGPVTLPRYTQEETA
jgi:hypothetical protein